MNALGSLLPKAAPSAPPDAASHPEPLEECETFASVMDRRNSPGGPRSEGSETSRARSATKEAESSDSRPEPEVDAAPRRAAAEDLEDTAVLLPQPSLVLPALPYHLPEAPGFSWQAIVGQMSTSEGEGDGTTDAPEAGRSPAPKPAQTTEGIFAGPHEELPILAAMFPVSMAQLQAQLQVRPDSAQKNISPLPTPLEETGAVQSSASLEARTVPTDAMPRARAVAPRPMPMAGRVEAAASDLTQVTATNLPIAPDVEGANGAPAAPLEWSSGRRPQPTRSFAQPALPLIETPLAPVPVEAPVDGGEARSQADPANRSAVALPVARPDRRIAPESTLVDGVLPAHGTPAAKGGEVMHDIPFQAPPKARAARTPEGRVAASGSVEFSQPTPATSDSEFPVLGPVLPEAQDRRAPEPRVGSGPQTESEPAASASAQPGAKTPSEFGPANPARHSPLAAEPAERAIEHVVAGHQAGAEMPIDSSNTLPAEMRIAPPTAERMSSEPASPSAPITRAEIVQLAERTTDAAVRLRASGSERIEVAVQLESGDHLTIQLHVANGEVTSHFRTSSEGLRTALEQSWAQFSERANDRGVRMTQPVFDTSQSSSNMTDLSQQRHGRDPGYTDPQAELFPNLPRRMRAPRVISGAPLEPASAAPAGVRTYA